MTKHLLPPNSTRLEKALAECSADIEKIDISGIKTLWNPDTCPPKFLPFLAWAYSVDKWDDKWTEQAQRDAIKNSFYVHSKKGTLSALRRVVEPMGLVLRVTRWYEVEPNLPRGSFELDIGLDGQSIDDVTFNELWRLISDAKPLTRNLASLEMTIQSFTKTPRTAATYIENTLSVYPA